MQKMGWLVGTQGHEHCHNSIEHIRLLFLFSYLVLCSRYSTLFVEITDFNLCHLHLAPLLGVTLLEFRYIRSLGSENQSPWCGMMCDSVIKLDLQLFHFRWLSLGCISCTECRAVAYGADVLWSMLVCLLDTTMSCAKMAAQIEMSFGCALGWVQGTTYQAETWIPWGNWQIYWQGEGPLQCGLLTKFFDHLFH